MEGVLQNAAAGANPDEVRSFFDGWRVYQQLLDNNYVGHRQVYGLLRRIIDQNFKRPFDLLDLGCGDAAFISRALSGTRARAYQGVDISPVALDLARQNMKPRDCEQLFTQSDLNQAVSQIPKPVDIIWTSLSLHHLSLEQKAKFLGNCRRHLKPQGCLLVFDLMMLPDETRPEFLKRWWDECRKNWRAMSTDARDSLREHVDNADFPAPAPFFEEGGRFSGFKRIKRLYAAPNGLYQLVSLEP